MNRSSPPEFVHVPTPGDHYSPATGSAVMTIIYELSRVHARRGGRTRIIVSKGTRHDYEVGECVEVAATTPPSRWRKGIDAGMARFGMPRPFGSASYGPAGRAVESDFEGVVFVHNGPTAIELFRKRYPKARVCLWAHNELFKIYAEREIRRLVERTAYVICVSHFIADGIKRQVGAELASKIVVIRNGVDVERFCPATEGHGISAAPPIILFLGRINPVKGPDLLLKAACRIQSPDRRFMVRIVGSNNFSASDPLTSYELELRRVAQPLADAVEFQPFVDRAAVVGEYQRAAVFCAPANWNEPFGLTLAEAMACGLPVVTSRRGGIPEVCGDAALYFDPPDVDALAKRLSGLLDALDERQAWGRRARQRAGELTWDRQYSELATLFE
jgi:glycosyltransferase involved in cell wall biosynthesis